MWLFDRLTTKEWALAIVIAVILTILLAVHIRMTYTVEYCPGTLSCCEGWSCVAI